MKKIKENKGITLIALIITIIILLILAVVTIMAVNGDGIIGKAKQAKSEYENAQAEEQGILDKYLAEMEGLIGNNSATGDQIEEIPEVITHYTAEEIEGSAYLFGIGSTQSTYVVAAFNEDFTEVVITKNGEESDGIMMDFAPWTSMQYSPMYNHRDTLQTAIIEQGVVNIGGGVSGGYSFNECTNLTNIQIANSVIDIGGFIFENTSWYNSQPDGLLYINEGVYGYKGEIPEIINIAAGTKKIYDSAITYDNVSTITIPSSVIRIGEAALKATYLRTIYCQTQEVADLLVDSINYYASNATVVVDPSKF